VAGASAFYEEFGSGIIVDFGTATTLDVVTGEGHYEGGVIFPGIEASAVGLSTQAAMLPQVPPDPPNSLSFSDTTSGLQSGLFYGTAGAVERLIDELVDSSSLEAQMAIVATGGGASDMNELTEAITHVRENLVLEGLISSLDK
jgi:type III pantothenate kinase